MIKKKYAAILIAGCLVAACVSGQPASDLGDTEGGGSEGDTDSATNEGDTSDSDVGDAPDTGGDSDSGDDSDIGGDSDSGDTLDPGGDSDSGDTLDPGGDSDSGDTLDPGGDSDTGDAPDTGEQATLVLEELAAGFCFVDGAIDSNHPGFSGSGFANSENVTGSSIEWVVNAKAGSADLQWRYASATDRPASLTVNGTEVDSMDFPSTGDWTTWETRSGTADLTDGDNRIRLEALSADGLANIDNLTVTGPSVTAGSCDSDTNTDPDPNTDPDTVSDSNLIGWASVSNCGSQGTTGGGDGEPTVTVTSADELESALSSSGALVIAVSGSMSSPGSISDVLDKTLIGINDAEITGGFVLSGSHNVIIKNIKFSDASDDSFELTGCECIWFDHCEFADGGDGNLDIVRGSDFVTVSWSRFYYTKNHSHMLSNLCGNSQPNEGDVGKINITFHHNWWGAGVRSRAPRVRYGKVHVFNNYYRYEEVDGNDGENYCIGAGYMSKLLVENNYFDNSKKPIVWMSDEDTAEVVEAGNTFDNAGDLVTRGDSFEPPYNYSMDPSSQVKDLVMAGAGVQ